MSSINKTKYLTILTLFFCSLWLIGCGGGGTGSDELSAFNLKSITPSSTKAKTLKFLWGASSNAESYTLCQAKDPKTQNNTTNCKRLTTVSDTNTPTLTSEYTFTSIIDATTLLHAKFFVIAHNSDSDKSSDYKSLTLEDYVKMITYLKADKDNIGENDKFGASVALSGDGKTLAVGSLNSEPVDIFIRVDGAWSKQKTLNVSLDKGFGYSLALSNNGNTLAVADPDSTMVYVFTRTDGKWPPSEAAHLNATSSKNPQSIALSSNGAILAVGDSGSKEVNVFTNVNGTWLKQSLTASDESFGTSVTLSSDGTILAVGAPSENSDSGTVNVFTRASSSTSSNVSWSTTPQQLKASNSAAGDKFGTSVTLSGNGTTLAVGAINESSASQTDQSNNDAPTSGAVYIFNRNVTSNKWEPKKYLKASNIGAGDKFGASVTLSSNGNILAVGAYGEDSASQTITTPDDDAVDSGAVYVFTRSSSSWSTPQYLKASNSAAGDKFGISVALALSSDSDTTLAVSAINEDSDGTSQDNIDTPDSGAVYLY